MADNKKIQIRNTSNEVVAELNASTTPIDIHLHLLTFLQEELKNI